MLSWSSRTLLCPILRNCQIANIVTTAAAQDTNMRNRRGSRTGRDQCKFNLSTHGNPTTLHALPPSLLSCNLCGFLGMIFGLKDLISARQTFCQRVFKAYTEHILGFPQAHLKFFPFSNSSPLWLVDFVAQNNISAKTFEGGVSCTSVQKTSSSKLL